MIPRTVPTFLLALLLSSVLPICFPLAADTAAETKLTLSTDRANNLCFPGESVTVTAALEGYEGPPGEADLALRAVDFFGEVVWEKTARARLGEGAIWTGPTGPLRPGFYWVRAMLKTEKEKLKARASVAAIEEPRDFETDTPFGIWAGDPAVMRRIGIKWLHTSLSWRGIEKEKGKFDFSGADKRVNEYIENGIHVFPTLRKPPDWAAKIPPDYKFVSTGVHIGWDEFPPADMEAWGNYVYETVKHFKGRVKYWEIWNEPWPNSLFFQGGTLDDYAELLKVAYERAKEADPDCVIAGLGGTEFNHAKLIFKRGGFDYMDMATIHIYQPGVAPESGWFREWIDKIHEVIESYGGGKRVWISESGWPTNKGVSENWQGISLEDNARYLVRAQVLAIAGGIEKFFWFKFNNSGTDPGNFEHHQGIMFHDLTPKPSMVTYSVLTQMLRGTEFERLVEFGDGGYAAYFSGGGRWCWVVWSAGKKFALPVPPAAKIVDMMGREAAAPAEKLEITGSPVYILPPDLPSAEALGETFK